MKIQAVWTRGAPGAILLAVVTMISTMALGQSQAFKIDGKTTSVSELYDQEQASFFEIEKEKHQLIERLGRERFLKHHWEKLGKKSGKTGDQAKAEYLAKNAKITNKEIKETIEKFKDYPQLKKLSKADKEKQVKQFLEQSKEQEAIQGIIDAGIAKKELVLMYPRPKEPVYEVTVNKDDPVRFGPEVGDVKPFDCKGGDCAITVVEYSEFQCPFCVRVLPAVKRLLTEYKGKVRWIVRDFPLSFHDRARPAAVAAKCAHKQGKYWDMYFKLFENQRSLADADFQKYAKAIKLDYKKWEECVKNPVAVNPLIDRNFVSGQKVGVTGTPAFFVNGRRLSGAQPYEKFKEIFEDELKNKTKS